MKTSLLPLILVALLLPGLIVVAQGSDVSLTATVIFPVITLREGPGLDHPASGRAAQGEMLTITGRSADSGWFQVTLADGGTAWLAAYLVTLDGDAARLPVVEGVPSAQDDRLFVPPGCDYFGIGPFYGHVGQSIVLTQGWEAATRALIDDYLSNVIQIVSFDGRLISTYSAYRGEPFYHEATGTWRVFWSFDMGPVAAGTHVIEWSQMFNRPVSDGLDNNGDGQPDTYGPDMATYRCTLIIQ